MSFRGDQKKVALKRNLAFKKYYIAVEEILEQRVRKAAIAEANDEEDAIDCDTIQNQLKRFHNLAGRYIMSKFNDVELFLKIDMFAQTLDLPTPPTV